jgi:integrase
MKRVAAARWQDPDAVFTNEVGRSLHRETWQKFHRALIAELNLPAITLHGLRHTSATLELDSGTHPKVVSERLGHRSIKTTLDLYSHVSLDLQKRAAEALDTRLTMDENATTSTGS